MKTQTQFRIYTAAARLAGSAAFCGMLLSAATVPGAAPILPFTPSTVSTVPANGDVNPYGVVFVPQNIPAGTLQYGDVLVSNFNNSQNLQGTGTTIMRVDKSGHVSLFYKNNSGQVGLSGALGILSNGMVLVGNLPTADGTAATAGPGTLIVIDRNGIQLNVVTETRWIQGPWGMAINDHGNGAAQLFVSNVLTGTVTRFAVSYSAATFNITGAVTVASGYAHRGDPAALELGPSGLYYDATHDILYVASSADNAIYAVPNAGTTTATVGTGSIFYQDINHLHGPLDLVLAPNGDFIVANSDGSNVDPNQPSELVEFNSAGQFVSQFSVDPNNGGAFGLAIQQVGPVTLRVAATDDNAATLELFTVVKQ